MTTLFEIATNPEEAPIPGHFTFSNIVRVFDSKISAPISGYEKLEGKWFGRTCCDPDCSACGANPKCNGGPVNVAPGTIAIKLEWSYDSTSNTYASRTPQSLPAIKVYTASSNLEPELAAYRAELGVPEAVFHCLQITSPGELQGRVIAIPVPTAPPP
jgi:hypothetical protein